MVYMSRIGAVTLVSDEESMTNATKVASPRGSKVGETTLVVDKKSKINATEVASPM